MQVGNYPRDLIGYAGKPVNADWPNKAKIAVQFVINYEEGSESCVLHGDDTSEAFLSEIVGASSWPNQRHMNMESIYEYGARSGFWRLHKLFTKHQLPVTVFGVGMALERNPEAVRAMLDADWEIASHGYRWLDYSKLTPEIERDHIRKSIDTHQKLTGEEPKGWYIGRTSEFTRDILLQETTPLYDADSYADDLPYWVKTQDKNHLIVPYTLDVNDMRFATPQGFNSGDQFFNYLKDTFDVLYAEGNDDPKMMSIGLHCRLIGRPGRIASLQRFIQYINDFPDAWVCKREEIAMHWIQHHPYPKPF